MQVFIYMYVENTYYREDNDDFIDKNIVHHRL